MNSQKTVLTYDFTPWLKGENVNITIRNIDGEVIRKNKLPLCGELELFSEKEDLFAIEVDEQI